MVTAGETVIAITDGLSEKIKFDKSKLDEEIIKITQSKNLSLTKLIKNTDETNDKEYKKK